MVCQRSSNKELGNSAAVEYKLWAPPMKKFKTWRSGTRSTRSQTQKRKEEALLERAMNPHTSGTLNHKPVVLWVFINDFTDSDNHAAALVWAKFLVKHQGLKGIYIAEPRHVDLGYYTTSDEFKRIISLVDHLRPRPHGDDEAIKTVLAGKLTQEIIDKSTIVDDSNTAGRHLNENERMLVSLDAPEKSTSQLTVSSCNDASSHPKTRKSEKLPKEMLLNMRSSSSWIFCPL